MDSDSPIPLPVSRGLKRLGLSLSLARRRRHMTQQDLAGRISTSINTIRRMEAGHPGTSLQQLARTLQIFGELEKLTELIDTSNDNIGLMLMDEQVPKRIRKSNKKIENGAF